MPRKIDKEKYLRILDRLEKGEKQSSIVIDEKCSYGTISAEKQWDKEGRPSTIILPTKSVANTSRIIFSIPTFWLDLLNENIEEGIWMDYSDAIVDIIRTYFRIKMDSYEPPHGDIPTFADKGENFRKIRRNLLKDIKN
ncbi:MAG: hypothetical protein ACFFC3_07010 [Candidatus Odinarchaeota archaeon]